MRIISNYEIVKDHDYDRLVVDIQKGLAKGWQPLGDLKHYRGGLGDQTFMQVMVQYGEEA